MQILDPLNLNSISEIGLDFIGLYFTTCHLFSKKAYAKKFFSNFQKDDRFQPNPCTFFLSLKQDIAENSYCTLYHDSWL